MAKVVYGGCLLKKDKLLTDTGLRIEAGKIVRIAPNEELTASADDEVYDCRDQILLPGFINGHEHMYGVFAHGIPAGKMVTMFDNFLTDFWWPCVEDRMDHELVKLATQWACIEMIETGVTAFVDILEGPNSIPGALAVEKEVIDKAGLRALLSFEACERVSSANGELGIRENVSFADQCGKEGLVGGMSSIHTLFTCEKAFVKQAKKESDRHHTLFHMHLSESDYEPRWTYERYGRSPVEVYEEWGILDQNVLASQLVSVSSEEIDILARHHVRAVSMPISNCEVGGGFAPINQMLSKGIPVGLGTDGYVNNFFEVMRAAFLVHKANEKSTRVMPAKLVYEMATRIGSEACGFGTGVLEEEKPADLITVKLDTPTPIIPENVYDQLILYRNPADVRNVFVNGSLLKKDGVVLTLNKEECLEALRDAAGKFWKKGE